MAKQNEKEMEPVVKCMYAGDPEDEYCKECDGINMVIDGDTYPCTQCQSYTVPDPEPETPCENYEQPREEEKMTEVGNYTSQGITTSIKAESGISIETKKGWYRFSYTEERIVPETADIEKEKEALWNTVNAEVDRQVDEIKSLL